MNQGPALSHHHGSPIYWVIGEEGAITPVFDERLPPQDAHEELDGQPEVDDLPTEEDPLILLDHPEGEHHVASLSPGPTRSPQYESLNELITVEPEDEFEPSQPWSDSSVTERANMKIGHPQPTKLASNFSEVETTRSLMSRKSGKR